ncbi:MAG: cytochrome c oxidase subunit II [Gemmataceae bacterium]
MSYDRERGDLMDTNFHLLPEQASTMAPRVDALFWFVTAVCVVFTLLIATLVVTFAVRYRRRTEDYFPKPVVGSKVLEVAWSAGPLVIVLIIFFWGATLYFDIMRTPDNALEVYVTGRQWMWHLQHPGGQREINQLHVPLGRPVKLILTSEDVLHDFYVPAFRVKMDAVPGKYTYMWFEPTKTGTFHLFCALYCGTEHSRMVGSVVVMRPEEYEDWLAERADRSLALQGRQLFQKLQCVTCHHPEANNRAPILENLFGRRVELENGRSAVADESYLRESILYPANKVRAGWRPIMPSFKGQVDENDLVRLIAFLKGLKTGETPSRVEESAPPAVQEKR